MGKFTMLLGGVVLVLFTMLGIAVLFTLPVWWLWNWLMPTIFGLKPITLVQAWGLNFLSALLIKGTTEKPS